jgi:DNA-binding response OmpR family regulator
MTRLLLVEDEISIAQPLSRALSSAGYDVLHVTTGGDAEIAVFEHHPDVIVLDLCLPDIDGIELCRRIRADHELVPIVVLTARREEMDAVAGLDAGADDYITKPFRLAELLARIRARLRSNMPTVLEGQDLRIDTAARRAWLGNDAIELAAKEFDLLSELVRRAGTAVRREHLIDLVWGPDFVGSTKTLDVHIAWLRQKLGDDANHPRYVSTVRGVGYRFESNAHGSTSGQIGSQPL